GRLEQAQDVVLLRRQLVAGEEFILERAQAVVGAPEAQVDFLLQGVESRIRCHVADYMAELPSAAYALNHSTGSPPTRAGRRRKTVQNPRGAAAAVGPAPPQVSAR